MDVSKIIKKITPGFIRRVQRAKRDELVKKEFAGLSNKEVFEKIYSEKRWGSAKDVKRKFSSGDGTRDDIIVEKYINSVKEFFGPSAINLSAVDVGCGDFTVGSKIYTNQGEEIKIKKSKIRGVISNGMVCAEDEIGLGDSHEGIMVLEKNIKPGTPVSEIFNIQSDKILEILPSNENLLFSKPVPNLRLFFIVE